MVNAVHCGSSTLMISAAHVVMVTTLKSFTSIRPASHLIMSLLGGLCVVCSECSHHVRLETYQQHIDIGCNSHNNLLSQDTSVEAILSRPIATPLTATELKLQSRLAKCSLAVGTAENVLKIKTRGQVCNVILTHIYIYTYTCSQWYIITI